MSELVGGTRNPTFYRQVTARNFHETTYQERFLELRNGPYLEFPAVISVETLSLCNAACNFCPYPNLARKGQAMPDSLIDKILTEIEEIQDRPPFEITLSRVNEPFLDGRILDISIEIERRLPEAVNFFFSNGTPLNEKNLLRLAELRRVSFLNVSVNEHRPRQYAETMGLPFERIVARLDLIHGMKLSGVLKFPVFVSRVGDGTSADAEFLEWVRTQYPSLNGLVTVRGNWLGAVQGSIGAAPNVGCRQWFQLHVLADGKVAYCAIDSDGVRGTGDAKCQHVIHEIYRRPLWAKLRSEISSRLEVDVCRTCPMLT
jgi:hypothetical protein